MELDEAITRLNEAIACECDGERSRQFIDDLKLVVAAAEAGRWRPIEEAPKDGTEILIVDRVGMCVAKWAEYCGWISYTDDGWYEACVWPTHWRPLPPAPEA